MCVRVREMSEERTSSLCEKSSLFQAQNTQFRINPQLAKKCHESSTDAIVIHGTFSSSDKLIIGRGHDATVKIGKSNKRVSRHHVSIEYKHPLNRFELTVLSPNGALIDHIVFEQGEHVPIMEGTCIEIVGAKLIFQGGPQAIIPTPTLPKEEEIIPNKAKNHAGTSLQDEVIQVLVSTRKSTMTCKDICNKLADQEMMAIQTLLSESAVIGCVKRLGKTADGSPKEDMYYYKAELDSNLERRKRYSDVGKSARKCTMKDTQYFFRIPPKPTTHKVRKRKELEEDEELKSNSNDDVSDMEVYELFKDV